MVNIRMIGLAAALALFVPAFAYALPSLWPGDDPSALIIEGGAEQYAQVGDIYLMDPPQPHVVEPNSTLGHEQLVEGHTVFATIDIVTRVAQDNGTVDVSAIVTCSAQTGVDYNRTFFGIPVPNHVHTTTVDCLENATLVAVPNPLPMAARSNLQPTGIVIAFTTPTGEVGYETEYATTWAGQSYYAYAVNPVRAPFVGADGHAKNLYVSFPVDRLREMGVHDFTILDARQLADSR